MPVWFSYIETPFGAMAAAVNETGALIEFAFLNEYGSGPHLARPDCATRDPQRLETVAIQVREYFEGNRRVFDLPLLPAGTPFQRKVWGALCDIPFGETISYQELARRVGDIKATQAVGAANGRNPIAVIIPCHRVIGKNGSLTGYAGGLPMKQALLAFEAPAPMQRELF